MDVYHSSDSPGNDSLLYIECERHDYSHNLDLPFDICFRILFSLHHNSPEETTPHLTTFDE